MNASKAAIATMRPEALMQRLTPEERDATLLAILNAIEQGDGAAIREALMDAAAWMDDRRLVPNQILRHPAHNETPGTGLQAGTRIALPRHACGPTQQGERAAA